MRLNLLSQHINFTKGMRFNALPVLAISDFPVASIMPHRSGEIVQARQNRANNN
jgi:hypothetical protein